MFSALPFEKWPLIDRELWLAARTTKELWDEPQLGATWRPATWKTVACGYGIALHWLERLEILDGQQFPPDRWDYERLRAYSADLNAKLRPATVRHRIVNLERALAVLAPESDRKILQSAIRRLPQDSDRSRKRLRLQEPAALIELGLQLMRMADDGFHASDRKNATFYRCGLQVALLAMRPLRMRNFSAIRLGHHLVRNPAGWELHFGGNETKNRRPIEISFPELLCPFLERYIEVYRKLLAGSGYQGDRLWLGYRFTPQSPHTLQLSIVRVTSQAFGQPVNPHLFRDCVATAIAFHDPKRVRMAAILLGHASFGTTQKYYNLAGGLEAGQEYARVLAERRRRV